MLNRLHGWQGAVHLDPVLLHMLERQLQHRRRAHSGQIRRCCEPEVGFLQGSAGPTHTAIGSRRLINWPVTRKHNLLQWCSLNTHKDVLMTCSMASPQPWWFHELDSVWQDEATLEKMLCCSCNRG